MTWKRVSFSILLAMIIAGCMTLNSYAQIGSPIFLASNASGLNFALQQELFILTNQERARHGLSPLELDTALIKLAQDHAEGMANQGFISHDVPLGNIFVRMNRIGYNYETVRENVATARTVSSAHSALLKSPGHKANMLATDVTSIGIGVAHNPSVCSKYLFIAEVFATPGESYEPSQVKDLLTTGVEKLQENGAIIIPAKRDLLFESIASRSLNSLGDSYSREDLRNLLAKSADELQENGKENVSRLEVSVQVFNHPEKLSIPDTLKKGVADMYGAAVRKIKSNSERPTFMVLTLIGMTR